jgi:hypothetical protein
VASILEQIPDGKAVDHRHDSEESGTHLVCSCQVDATPRLALCGSDCTDGDERMNDTVCTVCWNLGHVASLIGCERCRSDEWTKRFHRMGF